MTVLPKKDTDNIKAEIEIDEYSLRNFTHVLQTAREKGVLMVAILIQSTFKMHHTWMMMVLMFIRKCSLKRSSLILHRWWNKYYEGRPFAGHLKSHFSVHLNSVLIGENWNNLTGWGLPFLQRDLWRGKSRSKIPLPALKERLVCKLLVSNHQNIDRRPMTTSQGMLQSSHIPEWTFEEP